MSVTGVAGMYNIKRLFPGLIPPEEIFAGIPAPFRLSLHNSKTYLPSFIITVDSPAAQTALFPMVRQNSTEQTTVLITFDRRGTIPLGRITIRSPYPVGFFTRYWSFEIPQTVTVFPRPLAASSGGNGDESPAAGTGLRRERGLSGELEQIYPYSGAEPLRMIHWKHSARSDDLLVKGFGRTVAAPLMIDLKLLQGQGIEERLSRAAWLIQRWVRERPVGLQFGNRILPAGTGRRHGLQLLKELAMYDGN
jgi:uncharacterized protein (DUF58 family)